LIFPRRPDASLAHQLFPLLPESDHQKKTISVGFQPCSSIPISHNPLSINFTYFPTLFLIKAGLEISITTITKPEKVRNEKNHKILVCLTLNLMGLSMKAFPKSAIKTGLWFLSKDHPAVIRTTSKNR
ncbi:hypothetical protein AABB24_034063, partial [Solanum stoloniferum]